MHILLNELPRVIAPGTTLGALRDAVRPGADVLIVNGAPAGDPGQVLAEGDAVVLIRRGETPARDELEALMAARHTPGVHAILRRATVGIAGLGGLGSAVAVALARVGVGRLVLADFDVVEPSNLNRQQYFVDQIGMTKCEALAANLARIHPYVRVETHAVLLTPKNVPTIFAGVDVLVEAFDTAEGKAMLVESFMAARPATPAHPGVPPHPGVPAVDRLKPAQQTVAAHPGGQARSGVPIVVATGLAGHGPSNTIVTRRAGGPTSHLIVVGDGVSAARPGTGLMAPRVGVAAHHQANAVLRILLGEDPVGEE